MNYTKSRRHSLPTDILASLHSFATDQDLDPEVVEAAFGAIASRAQMNSEIEALLELEPNVKSADPNAGSW